MVKSIKGILFATVMGVSVLVAAPGDLDLTFGVNGLVSTDFDGNNDYGKSVAIQNDGKIVMAGVTSGKFALTRYDTNGGLDTTFGINGKITTDFGGTSDRELCVTIQDDGKIVVAGSASGNFALARYDTNGGMDVTFGVAGMVTTDFSGNNDAGHSVTIQNDGKIVVAGVSSSNFALARYDTNGGLDVTFGIGGMITTDFTGIGYSVTIQDDGKIVVAGSYANDFSLARYNTNGTLDATFGIDGIVTTNFGGISDKGYSVTIQDDGKIVVAGDSLIHAGSCMINNFALARYDTNGELDATFGVGGMVTTDLTGNFDVSRSVTIQNDGKIVVAGAAGNHCWGVTAPVDIALTRYDMNGILDTTFGMGGMVTTDFDGNNSAGHSVAIQDDGKIVVAGVAGDVYIGYDFGLARYEGDPTQRVDIDIVPKKSQNVIKYKIKKGQCHGAKAKVAVLSTSDFDVTLIDPSSAMLGDPKLDGKVNPTKSKIRDVNHDGYDDIQFTFSICDLVNEEALNADTTKLILTGETPDGIIVTGKDMVEVVQR